MMIIKWTFNVACLIYISSVLPLNANTTFYHENPASLYEIASEKIFVENFSKQIVLSMGTFAAILALRKAIATSTPLIDACILVAAWGLNNTLIACTGLPEEEQNWVAKLIGLSASIGSAKIIAI